MYVHHTYMADPRCRRVVSLAPEEDALLRDAARAAGVPINTVIRQLVNQLKVRAVRNGIGFNQINVAEAE